MDVLLPSSGPGLSIIPPPSIVHADKAQLGCLASHRLVSSRYVAALMHRGYNDVVMIALSQPLRRRCDHAVHVALSSPMS